MYFKPSACGVVLQNNGKMVKNKRDLKSPRRRSLLTRPTARKVGVSGAVSSANIKVVVRVRPPSEKEENLSGGLVVRIINEQLLIFDPETEGEGFFYHGVQQKGRDLLKKPKKNMQFAFDRVFGFESNNKDVFEESTEQLIDKLMEGCNCSVFVYGATGAGKTHTMLGHTECPGITFLTMKRLFERKTDLINDRDFELAITYLEVYNENVQDLLNPGIPLQLREDGKFGVIVAGITMKMIKSSEELFELLEQGNRNRTQHPTDANAESSRSHAVFQVYIRMTSKITRQVHMAKLSMIDLAGSERGAATGCVGVRFKEGSNINKSLLALGNCINSLAAGKGHVPYRDSKLTRLLKDSLGGNCHTVMIANVSPSSLTYEDTYNTLKYATRAMKIKSHVRQNVVAKDINVEQYIIMIDNLKAENERLKMKLEQYENSNENRNENRNENKNDNKNDIKTDNKDDNNYENGNENCEIIKNIKMNETITLPTTSSLTLNEDKTDSIADKDKEKLMEIVDELKRILERIFQLEMNKQRLGLCKQRKEDTDARLSDFCDSIDKLKGHKRIGDAVDRLERQVVSLKDEIAAENAKKIRIYERFDRFLDAVPGLKRLGDIEKVKLQKIEADYKVELQQQKYEKISMELKSHIDMEKKMSSLLKTCYRYLQSQNYLPESVKSAYNVLKNDWKGVHTVTFETESDHQADSTVIIDDSRKRKVEETCSGSSMDATFAMTSKSQPVLSMRAKELLSKDSPVPPRKLAKISPAIKENKTPNVIVRKPTAVMGTSQRFPITKSNRLFTNGKVLKKK